MKNRIEQYQEVNRARFNKDFDRALAQDMARADDDGFVRAGSSPGVQPADQDSDCWGNLWECMKAYGLNFFRRKQSR